MLSALVTALHTMTEEYLAIVEPNYPSYNAQDTVSALVYWAKKAKEDSLVCGSCGLSDPMTEEVFLPYELDGSGKRWKMCPSCYDSALRSADYM